MNDSKRIIMVSNLFNENNGSYATYGENIVHETINFFRSDDGNIYIYIPPRGTIGNEYINQVGNMSLLITCGYGEKTLKVLYYIEKMEYVQENGEKVKYGNKTLEEIFGTNVVKDGSIDLYENHVTFKTKSLKKPKDVNCPILLTNFDSNDEDRGRYSFKKKLRNQSMRCYFCESKENNNNNEDYNTIKRLINNTEWEEFSLPKADGFEAQEKKDNFFNIIHKEDDELAFSNMFAYFFTEYPELFAEFLAKKDIELKTKFTIDREKNRIDLFVSDGYTRIIIENKIKSGINGIKNDYTSQLNKYIDSIINDDDIENESKQDIAKSIKCLIFRPEYVNLERYSKYLECESSDDNVKTKFKYTQISYKEIYNFYNEKQKELKLDDNDAIYFKLFLEAMEKHTRPTDTDIEDRMKARFINRIKELQNQTE